MRRPPINNFLDAVLPRSVTGVVRVLLLCMAVVTKAPAEPLDPPIAMTIVNDGTPVRGKVVAVEQETFDFETADGQTVTYPWRQLPAGRVLAVYTKVLDRDDAAGWFGLGVMLYGMDDGKTAGESALRRATAADPSLEEQAQRVRRGEAVSLDDPDDHADPHQTPGEPGHSHAGGEASGPVSVGDVQSRYWGTLTPELMASSVEELKARAGSVQETLNIQMRLYEDESPYFLFYTDLPAEEAKRWAGLLNRMYARMCEMFGIEEGVNIFRGRALILVFRQADTFYRYHREVRGDESFSQNYLGICESFGNGHVVITFYRQPEELKFAHLLVHETAHGFLHRYRSFPHVVSWANEGLAEVIASRLVPNKETASLVVESAKYNLQVRRSLGGDSFWGESNIQGWQYPVAQLLCEFMIAQSKERYQAFINAIKDGKPWRQALEEDYGIGAERLVAAFGQHLGLDNLRP